MEGLSLKGTVFKIVQFDLIRKRDDYGSYGFYNGTHGEILSCNLLLKTEDWALGFEDYKLYIFNGFWETIDLSFFVTVDRGFWVTIDLGFL